MHNFKTNINSVSKSASCFPHNNKKEFVSKKDKECDCPSFFSLLFPFSEHKKIKKARKRRERGPFTCREALLRAERPFYVQRGPFTCKEALVRYVQRDPFTLEDRGPLPQAEKGFISGIEMAQLCRHYSSSPAIVPASFLRSCASLLTTL